MKKLTSLLAHCPTGGCGAKIDPRLLSSFLQRHPYKSCDNLLVSHQTSDDAAIWSLSPDLALVSTVDFFPPMVDDSRLFGRIAATNALSDVYAMGGRPIMALNIVCFPQKMDPEVLAQILAGGAEVIEEAGAFVAGGHSIYDSEPKYGLAVTGLVNPKKILRNDSATIGQAFILTKPLGVGLILSAYRAKASREKDFEAAIESMTLSNQKAAEIMEDFEIGAATDVTGFGFLGHLNEMAGEKLTIDINFDSIPILPGVLDYAAQFYSTALAQRNRNHMEGKVDLGHLSPAAQEILFDPQTSGGLLISLDSKLAPKLLTSLKENYPHAAIIGQASQRSQGGPAAVIL
ncbi:MAG: selenide, water dikinase SelD [Deltaproteobacteria bacterium]|jgi:selenide,water dikinase|nr:selenide, water dikinase SelD [Deltaproteobacteria bacterium]